MIIYTLKVIHKMKNPEKTALFKVTFESVTDLNKSNTKSTLDNFVIEILCSKALLFCKL